MWSAPAWRWRGRSTAPTRGATRTAAALDALSFGAWLRAEGARPAVVRLHELGALSLAGGSIERRSLLGQLRVVAAAGYEEI